MLGEFTPLLQAASATRVLLINAVVGGRCDGMKQSGADCRWFCGERLSPTLYMGFGNNMLDDDIIDDARSTGGDMDANCTRRMMLLFDAYNATTIEKSNLIFVIQSVPKTTNHVLHRH